MLGPRKVPTRRQPGEITPPATGRSRRTCSSQSRRQSPRGSANSRDATVAPGRTTRASSRKVAAGSSTYLSRYVKVRPSKASSGNGRLSALASTSRTSGPSRRRASASISGVTSTPTTAQPFCRISSRATAPVPVATSRTVSPGPASTRETRNRRQRGSCPNERSDAYRSYVGPNGAKSARADTASAIPAESMLGGVGVSDDVRRIADTAGRFAGDRERVVAVLAAEPAEGQRTYLVAFSANGDDGRSWLALDDGGHPVTSRDRVRE